MRGLFEAIEDAATDAGRWLVRILWVIVLVAAVVFTAVGIGIGYLIWGGQ